MSDTLDQSTGPPPGPDTGPSGDASETAAGRRANGSLLAPRKLVAQLIGFGIGVALLAWCVWMAVSNSGDAWERLLDANPWLVIGLGGCSLVSLCVNGLSFWLVARPMRSLRLTDMLLLNYVTALLNYAPIRAGLIARIAYHLRVDRMTLFQIGAWIAALGYTLLLVLGAFIASTVIRPVFDGWWVALLLGQLLLGGLLTWAIMGQPIVTRFGKGMDRMLRDPVCLWGAIGLRVVDIGAFVGRMACAVAILDLSLSASHVLLLGSTALALSVNPLGRTGFREIAVAFVASRLAAPDLNATTVDGQMATLALIESAGEALVSVPLGAISLIWYRRRWKASLRRSVASPTP